MSTSAQGDILFDSPSTELSSHRTSLSIERTRMGADRTLMATLRTSLSLIGFGFTIFKFFKELGEASGIDGALAVPARNFGLSLVIMGILLLVAGLFNHWQLFVELRARRTELHEKGLLLHAPRHRTSPTAVLCVLLLLVGLLVILGIIARTGPFG